MKNILRDPFIGETVVDHELVGACYIKPFYSPVLSKLINSLRGNYIPDLDDPNPVLDLVFHPIKRTKEEVIYEFVKTNFEEKIREIYDYAKIRWNYQEGL